MSKKPVGGASSLARLLNVSLEQEDTRVVQNLNLSDIHPDPEQVRRFFDPLTLQSLADSIRKVGVQNPIQVQPRPEGGHWIVTGERRYRASLLAGKETIPAVVLPQQSPEQLALLQMIENAQREDLDPYTQTVAVVGILSLTFKQAEPELVRWLGAIGRDGSETALQDREKVEEVLKALHPGLTFLSFVKNRLPLLQLPEDLRTVLQQGKLEYTKARILQQVKNDRERSKLLTEALEHQWSLQELKTQVRVLLDKQKPEKTSSGLSMMLRGKEARKFQKLSPEKKALVEAKWQEIQELLQG
ncbi:ParB/RepB/Spo0J family partition protein [Deinococcus misasensis]|uniref:ParB/RepB/Spo0J family partition protein n=1 Tax=Deinococcus misasensis TaxID=392413 RepID=UPI0005587694|nr:ParB/RepB/Spo0J family partition protein [Deinococcus misasensis]